MEKKVEEIENARSEVPSKEDIREKLYEQFGVTKTEKVVIDFIPPTIHRLVQLGSNAEWKRDTDLRLEVLAEMALIRAYGRVPKFKLFTSATVLLGVYDLLHSFNPEFYGMTLIALASLNGFIASLRSPKMMAAELEGITDEDGMPADYQAKALSIANTNVTIVLFSIAVCVQFLVTSSFMQGELLTRNVADGILPPSATALALLLVPFILALEWMRG